VLLIIPALLALFLIFSCNRDKEDAAAAKVETVNVPVKSDESTVKPGDVKSGEVYSVVEQMPEFPGGQAKLSEFLGATVKYPKLALEKGITGKVYVSFVVQKNGKIADVKVIRGADPLLDAEAVRAVSAMPDWTPGKEKGVAVDVIFNLPINFKLDDKK
jgi:TonB family protein